MRWNIALLWLGVVWVFLFDGQELSAQGLPRNPVQISVTGSCNRIVVGDGSISGDVSCRDLQIFYQLANPTIIQDVKSFLDHEPRISAAMKRGQYDSAARELKSVRGGKERFYLLIYCYLFQVDELNLVSTAAEAGKIYPNEPIFAMFNKSQREMESEDEELELLEPPEGKVSEFLEADPASAYIIEVNSFFSEYSDDASDRDRGAARARDLAFAGVKFRGDPRIPGVQIVLLAHCAEVATHALAHTCAVEAGHLLEEAATQLDVSNALMAYSILSYAGADAVSHSAFAPINDTLLRFRRRLVDLDYPFGRKEFWELGLLSVRNFDAIRIAAAQERMAIGQDEQHEILAMKNTFDHILIPLSPAKSPLTSLIELAISQAGYETAGEYDELASYRRRFKLQSERTIQNLSRNWKSWKQLRSDICAEDEEEDGSQIC